MRHLSLIVVLFAAAGCGNVKVTNTAVVWKATESSPIVAMSSEGTPVVGNQPTSEELCALNAVERAAKTIGDNTPFANGVYFVRSLQEWLPTIRFIVGGSPVDVNSFQRLTEIGAAAMPDGGIASGYSTMYTRYAYIGSAHGVAPYRSLSLFKADGDAVLAARIETAARGYGCGGSGGGSNGGTNPPPTPPPGGGPVPPGPPPGPTPPDPPPGPVNPAP